ncbi:uncharacterized protein BP01DRAFT_392069 [Aspergillus saccharolyticus JOP 1030-1]|uniref:Uncharacterized protein n=1 Tax=Aspergillus saccharolyticus JOP 1030-1 TaxID=1450539 RepID=A0A318ZKP4_9EURO|nr:hypothetical protein BP01DRAFT_392069 [Aspergillus saccharolyticus JOP 1030-1]PYH45123.1 hypothetical protein BP01DRAFT_392069 [Aspergillus saccharolyticus JOP 1030-1]
MPTTTKPTILLTPGIWEGPTVYNKLSTLTKASYPVQTSSLVSTGAPSPGNPTMKDDVAAIRAHLTSLVDSRGQLVAGQPGGVIEIVFLAAAVFSEGHEHAPLPFAFVEVSQPERVMEVILGAVAEFSS